MAITGQAASEQSPNLSSIINEQLARCSSGCTVRLPAGDFYFGDTVVLSRPGLRLVGEGARATHLHYVGPSGSAALELRMRPFTIDSHNAIEGLSIELETAGTIAILTGDVTSGSFRDLFIQCNHQPRSYGILAQLERGWFERNLFEAIDVKYCSADLEFSLAPMPPFPVLATTNSYNSG